MSDSILRQLLTTRVPTSRLNAFCIDAMLRAGMREEDARVTSDVLVTTDTWGTFTHGSKQLRLLMKLAADRVDLKAVPEIVSQGPAWALIDGHYALAPVIAVQAMQLAIEKAKTAGIAYVGVRGSNHFGACAYYANMAVEHDMIGLAMTNANPMVAVPGGRTPILGTNPFSYAVPAGEERPIVLDIATSIVAASKVIAARMLGKTIPDNWVVDDEGHPTTDPSEYPEKGVLLPMGGHKGYGIALMIELLAGALTGAQVLDEVKIWITPDSRPLSQGHCFIAINVDAIMPIAQFKTRVDGIIRHIRNAPRAAGTDRIYLPGEMEWERRDIAMRDGILLPEDVLQRHEGLAQDYHMDLAALLP